jgi:hypothetical protein
MKAVAVILAALAVATNGESLRASIQGELEAGANHPICLAILNDWWPAREAEKAAQHDSTSLDSKCAAFNGQPELCNVRKSRAAAGVAADLQDIACTMIGAHNHTCVSNKCNMFNTGDCTLQATAGECVWYTADEVKATNAYFKANNIDDNIPGHGCYRNPCNRPGYGKLTSETCASFSTDRFTCTWCKGKGALKGKGMGCQISESTQTTAQCAYVNHFPESERSNIVESVTNNVCQCNTAYSACADLVGSRAGAFKPRFS